MKNILLGILRFLGRLFPYALLTFAGLVFVNVQNDVTTNIKSLQGQFSELESNQTNEYNTLIKIDEILAQNSSVLSFNIQKVKDDSIAQNQQLINAIYSVDKNSLSRATAIVDGVNKLVDDVSYTLQKPSYKYLKAITVRLVAKNKDPNAVAGQRGWMGTGVIIAIDKDFTYILTNRHVVSQFGDGTHKYYVRDDTGNYPFTAIKISQDENVDLALVRIDGHIDGKMAVIGFAEAQIQDNVYMVGMNLGRPFFYAEGTVAGFDPKSNDELVVGMPSGPGNSGSGIINKDGKLVGLLYAGSIIDEDGIDMMDTTHGLCIPIKEIRLFLAGYIN